MPFLSLFTGKLAYSLLKVLLKMIFPFPRWDMLVPWRVLGYFIKGWTHCRVILGGKCRVSYRQDRGVLFQKITMELNLKISHTIEKQKKSHLQSTSILGFRPLVFEGVIVQIWLHWLVDSLYVINTVGSVTPSRPTWIIMDSGYYPNPKKEHWS